MRYEVQGRVTGHQIYQPNPKDEPDLELVKLTLVLTPATEAAEKHTRAVLVVDKDASFEDFVLGRVVRITIEDSQQDLFLPLARETRAADGSDEGRSASSSQATISMTDPNTGEVVSAPLEKLERGARALSKRGRSRRERAH